MRGDLLPTAEHRRVLAEVVEHWRRTGTYWRIESGARTGPWLAIVLEELILAGMIMHTGAGIYWPTSPGLRAHDEAAPSAALADLVDEASRDVAGGPEQAPDVSR
jgi:hypothetical protein